MENSDTDNNYKEMAVLCLKLYTDCIKYKKQKEKHKDLDCDIFYNNFEYFSIKINDDRDN